MNIAIEIVGAVLSRVAGWVVLSLVVWVLRMVGKGLGSTAQSVLALVGARRLPDPPGAPGTAVTCPHCGAGVAPGPFCAVCGRALPARQEPGAGNHPVTGT